MTHVKPLLGPDARVGLERTVLAETRGCRFVYLEFTRGEKEPALEE